MISAISYIKARLDERSTWAAISGAIVGGAALSAPYSWILIGVGVVGALAPTGAACHD